MLIRYYIHTIFLPYALWSSLKPLPVFKTRTQTTSIPTHSTRFDPYRRCLFTVKLGHTYFVILSDKMQRSGCTHARTHAYCTLNIHIVHRYAYSLDDDVYTYFGNDIWPTDVYDIIYIYNVSAEHEKEGKISTVGVKIGTRISEKA